MLYRCSFSFLETSGPALYGRLEEALAFSIPAVSSLDSLAYALFFSFQIVFRLGIPASVRTAMLLPHQKSKSLFAD